MTCSTTYLKHIEIGDVWPKMHNYRSLNSINNDYDLFHLILWIHHFCINIFATVMTGLIGSNICDISDRMVLLVTRSCFDSWRINRLFLVCSILEFWFLEFWLYRCELNLCYLDLSRDLISYIIEPLVDDHFLNTLTAAVTYAWYR